MFRWLQTNMLDLKLLETEEYFKKYQKSLSYRGGDLTLIDQVLKLNQDRKKSIQSVENKKAEQNKASAVIAKFKKEKQDATEQLSNLKKLSDEIKTEEVRLTEIESKLQEQMSLLPNHVHDSVPIGKGAEDNKKVREWGTPKKFNFKPKEHTDIGEKLGILDFERAGKIAGARFAILKGFGARLERAIIQFMLDVQTNEHGYTETIPPYIVNSNSFFGTGQFPKFKDDVFHIQGTDYHLIPTAEVPVTNYFSNEILKEEDLPIYLTAFTPCFRSEAGSYGKDTKGLIRQHQFHKVELVKFSHPEKSYEEHEKMTQNAEAILQKLGLPYKIVSLCTTDLGFSAAKTYDLEVWLPGQNAYREISSCSNCEDFQARRANIRFRSKEGKPRYVHTLNGSGLAVGRTWIAILENYQCEDGSIDIPEVLQPYLNGLKKFKKTE